MAQAYHYQNAIGAAADFDVEVGDAIRLGEHGLAADARLASVATSAITVDDPDGGLAFLSHQRFYVDEDEGREALTLTGTVDKDSTSTTIVGHSSAFLTELTAGDEVAIPGGGGTDYVFVESVTDDTHAVLFQAPANTATGQAADRAGRQRLWTGLTEDKEITRGMDRQAGGEIHGAGRSITLDLSEIQKLLHTRKIKTTTVGHDRTTEETVGDRLAWFLGTDIAADLGIFDEGLVTYPSDLVDHGDLAGKYVDDFLVELGVVTGRNMAVYYHEATGNLGLFHKKPVTFAMPMGLRLTNVDAEEDATTLVVDADPEPRLVQSGQAIVSTLDVTYGRATQEVELTATVDTFGEIDGDAPAQEFRTFAKAAAYGQRDLEDNSAEVDTITCSVTVPAAIAGDFRPLAMLEVHLSHFDGWQAFRWARIWHLERHQAIAANGLPVPGYYKLSLTLSPADGPTTSCDCTPTQITGPLGWRANIPSPAPNYSDGVQYYASPSRGTYATYSQPGASTWWNFGDYCGRSGYAYCPWDKAGDNAQNELRLVFVGNGTLNGLFTAPKPGDEANPDTFDIFIKKQTIAGNYSEATYSSTLLGHYSAGDEITATVDDRGDGVCIWIVSLRNINRSPSGSSLLYGGFDYTSACEEGD